jgi:hypothetical protein
MKNLKEEIKKADRISHFVWYHEFKQIKDFLEDLDFCNSNPYSSQDLLNNLLIIIKWKFDLLKSFDDSFYHDEESKKLIFDVYEKMIHYWMDLKHDIEYNVM